MKVVDYTAIVLLATFVAAEDINQRAIKALKGVPKGSLSLYQPIDGQFSCFDGSKQIRFTQVNDDYCDCADGSDEPGTSACSNSNYYCENDGHRGEYVLSSRVNDKICDCCDGSDEYNSGISCPNICDEIGRADRVIREKKANIARAGYAKRVVLAETGRQLKEEKLKDVEPLKAEKEALEAQLKGLEAAKKAAEEVENNLKEAHRNAWAAVQEEKKKVAAGELFKTIDKDDDGKITIEEARAIPYLDHDHDGQVTEEDVKQTFTEESTDFEAFRGLYDRLIDQKKSYEEVKAVEETMKNEEEKPLDQTEDEDDELLAEEDRHQKADSDEMPPFPEEALTAEAATKEAKKLYDEVFYKADELRGKIEEAESFASFDFGDDLAWAALKGQCFETDIMQYTYKLCPFDRSTQKDKNGHGDVGLGNFKEWTGEGNKYSRQLYNEGQQCWNGPKRSTQVEIECGEENAIVEVSEPAKCEYFFKFTTPAACEDPDKVSHSEL